MSATRLYQSPNNAPLVVSVSSAAFSAILTGSDAAFEMSFSGSTLAGQIRADPTILTIDK
ncbi:hypothetical protein LXA43DRAFT_1104601 [Ganoderma leucocontextum]|nr:hypothetical protein LXA43DRAFT_1104601 [Ganoderma leucocontextum]